MREQNKEYQCVKIQSFPAKNFLKGVEIEIHQSTTFNIREL